MAWFRWLSDSHSGKWHESLYATKEEEQDHMRIYMDPLQYPGRSRMYEITDIKPPEEEIF
jgi:Glu-tRNA(Gln) amidotransferase subunit E-like FAD-binding protein